MLNLLEVEEAVLALLKQAMPAEVQCYGWPDEWLTSGRVNMRQGAYVRVVSAKGDAPNKAIVSNGADARTFTCNIELTLVQANLRPARQAGLYELLGKAASSLAWSRPLEDAGRMQLLDYAADIARIEGFWKGVQTYSINLPCSIRKLEIAKVIL